MLSFFSANPNATNAQAKVRVPGPVRESAIRRAGRIDSGQPTAEPGHKQEVDVLETDGLLQLQDPLGQGRLIGRDRDCYLSQLAISSKGSFFRIGQFL